MGLLNLLKSTVADLAKGLGDEIKKFSEGGFLDAAIAAGFVIANADNKITSDEITKLRGFIDRNEALKVFPATKVSEIFSRVRTEYEFDPDLGDDLSKKMIMKAAGDPDRVHALMRLACVIGRADGDFDDQEKAAARKIAGWLNASPGDYGL